MLAAVLLALFAGAAAAGGNPPLVMTSLTVQPDQCEGYAIVWTSTDGGESWHPFVQSSVRGDPTNCPPISHEDPYYSQSSLEWTPGPGHGPGAYPSAPAAGIAGPWGESQQVTLDEDHGASTGSLVTTVPQGHHEAETYYAQTSFPSPYAQMGFSYGARPGKYQKHP
jgi:hypothetical protein